MMIEFKNNTCPARRDSNIYAFAALIGPLLMPVSMVANSQTGQALPPAVTSGVNSDIQTGTSITRGLQRQLSSAPRVEDSVPGGFYPSITLSARKEDNAFRDAEDEEDDTNYSISPSLVWRADLARHTFQAGVSTTFQRSSDFDELDSDSVRANAAFGLDISEKLKGDVYAGIVDGEETRGTSGSRTDITETEDNDEFDETILGARMTLGQSSSGIQISAGIETSDLEFTNNEQNDRDRSTDTMSAGVSYSVSPKTTVFADFKTAEIDYDSSTAVQDNDTDSLGIGATWEVTDVSSILLSVADTEKDFDDPALEDSDDSTYTGRFTWRPGDHNTLALYASKDVADSTDDTSSFFNSTLIGISASRQLTDRWGANAFYNMIDDDFSEGRKDEISDFGVGVSYGFSSVLSLSAFYNQLDRDSTDPEAENDSKIIGVSATLRTVIGE